MRLEGTYLFAAPREAVWEALMDPAVLAGALPGGEQMEQTGENQYRAVMNVKVGPVQGRFEGKILLEDILTPESYLMKVDGQGAPGFVAGEGRLELEEADAGGTVLRYGGDVTVGGRIAGVGQRLIESTAKSIIKQGLAALDGQIQARVAAQPVAAAVAATAEAVSSAVVEIPEAAVVEAKSEVPTVADVAPVAAPVTVAVPAVAPVAASPAVAEAAPKPVAAKPVAPKPAAAPSINTAQIAMEVAKDVSRDLLSDVIPLKNQEKVLWFSLGAVAMFLLVVIIRSVA